MRNEQATAHMASDSLGTSDKNNETLLSFIIGENFDYTNNIIDRCIIMMISQA